MTKEQFSQAWAIAKSNKVLDLDFSILDGCGLSDFTPKYVTIETVAAFLRWQCCYIFNDGFDEIELDNCARIARKKFLIV